MSDEKLLDLIGERIADEVEKVAAGRQSNCEEAAKDVLRLIALGEGSSRDLSPPITAVTSGQSLGAVERAVAEVNARFPNWAPTPAQVGYARAVAAVVEREQTATTDLLRRAAYYIEWAMSKDPKFTESDRKVIAGCVAEIRATVIKAECPPSSASPAMCEESRDEQSNGSLALQEGIGN